VGTDEVRFPNARGHLLSGRLDLPEGAATGFALFAHCFTCSKRTRASARICRALTRHGIGVLRFDFTGLGESEGEFADHSFSSSVDDLVAAADWMRRQGYAPRILVGHSLGGAAVIAAASRIPESVAVVTINAPADTAHTAHLIRDPSGDLAAHGVASVEIAGRVFTVRRELLDDLGSQPQMDRIRALGKALLVMHSPQDATVGIDNARIIFEAARHPKSFVALDGASHLLEADADARLVADVVAAWVGRYLWPAAGADTDAAASRVDHADDMDDADDADDALPAGTVVVEESGRGRYGQVVRAGRHTWTADEPRTLPGAVDSGPSPYDHLLAALGSCTSMTVRMYADRKGWPLTGVRVALRMADVHADRHADHLRACTDDSRPDAPATMRGVVREITLSGDLDDGQRARLQEIADKCPVHRTLHQGLPVVPPDEEA
jgi:putative redox protein